MAANTEEGDARRVIRASPDPLSRILIGQCSPAGAFPARRVAAIEEKRARGKRLKDPGSGDERRSETL